MHFFIRHWQWGKSIESVQCTGMTSMEPKVCPMRQVLFLIDSKDKYYFSIVVSLQFWAIYGKQVVSVMREIVSKDNQNLTSNSFLLDDDLRYTTFSHLSSFSLVALCESIRLVSLLLCFSGQFLLEWDLSLIPVFLNWN